MGDGKKEAISLAAQHEKTLLIMDDRLARKQAKKYGISFIGTVRILDIAEQQGIIMDAGKIIEIMRKNGYRISPSILAMIRETET
ncbi:MAG TPA: DUF3368 domain-containing protein [Gammaproteobacteria bacterium]|nr:DUF3368 domain-containing protein [Gammaproteobacteria bacterium]